MELEKTMIELLLQNKWSNVRTYLYGILKISVKYVSDGTIVEMTLGSA